MRVVITGASGLIGTALSERLSGDGHEVVPLRRPDGWDPDAGTIDTNLLQAADAVVHLAGEGIGEKRWTDEQKARIRDSRTRGTRLIAETLAGLDGGPRVLLSGSAIGYYGDTGDTAVDETAPAGHDFLASVCVDWEAAAAPAVDAGLRVVWLRTGIVLSPKGGALARQLPFFRLGLGGRSGSGRQYQSWISLDDEVGAICHLLGRDDLSGPFNLTAPEPVTNGEFARTLGRVLRRPTTIIPMFGPRLLFGRELADSLLLASQRVLPAALESSGYTFTHTKLDAALRDLLA
jgi:uncharacterized protein (TIGR01777 family)